MKLKIKLDVWENTLVCQILEQDLPFEKFDGHIIINEKPDLGINFLSLRGRLKEYDNEVLTFKYDDVVQAEIHRDLLLEKITEELFSLGSDEALSEEEKPFEEGEILEFSDDGEIWKQGTLKEKLSLDGYDYPYRSSEDGCWEKARRFLKIPYEFTEEKNIYSWEQLTENGEK